MLKKYEKSIKNSTFVYRKLPNPNTINMEQAVKKFKCDSCNKKYIKSYLAYIGTSRKLPIKLVVNYVGDVKVCHYCYYKVQSVSQHYKASIDFRLLPF